MNVITVGIHGKRGAGKDTFGGALAQIAEDHGWKTLRRGFADALKEEAAHFLSLNGYEDCRTFLYDYASEERAEEVLAQLFPVQGTDLRQAGMIGLLQAMHSVESKERFRKMLQWWGTEYRRQQFSDTYWVDRLGEWVTDHSLALRAEHAASSSTGGPTVKVLAYVPDVRFRNEADYIRKDMGGYLVSVHRPELATVDIHPSEVELDAYSRWDAVIRNNGSLDQFLAKAKNVFSDLRRRRFRSR